MVALLFAICIPMALFAVWLDSVLTPDITQSQYLEEKE